MRPPRRRTCRVRVGAGALAALVEDLAADPPGTRLFLIADDRVAPLHARPLLRRMRSAGLTAELLEFPSGERYKSRATKSHLEDELARRGAGRDAAIVAVGGGVTGDLAGFVAATWQRGIPVVQVPTTLLAMADAAIGGKTAVDLPAGKNLVGAFHQPWGVYADPTVLHTLDDATFVQGLAEVIKSAVIADEALFNWLERHVSALTSRDGRAVESAVCACVAIKARIVQRDERDEGRRAVLNFGHTIAHALEWVTRYRVPHGSAVAIGSAVEAELARVATGFPERHVERLVTLLHAAGLPTALPIRVDVGAVARATRRDKKSRNGQPRYALPSRIGRMPRAADPTLAVDARLVRSALRRGRASN